MTEFIVDYNKIGEGSNLPPSLIYNTNYEGVNVMTKSDTIKPERICKVDGCSLSIHGYGYCNKHYRRLVKKGVFGSKKKCIVESCNNFKVSKNYCGKHKQQIHRYGEILDTTIFDKNDILIIDETVKIVLRNIKHEKIAETIIDKEDLDLISKYKWHIRKGYASANVKVEDKKSQKDLHQILNPEWKTTDHIDGNPLNNRRINLREATQQQNCLNKKFIFNKSRFKGVRINKQNTGAKYQARLRVNKKEIYIGSFLTAIDAAEAYDKAALKYHGEFAKTNKMLGLL